MNLLPSPVRTLIALFFIAISAFSIRANAQNDSQNVVTTEQVRAELMAYAPDGIDAGKPVWVGLQITHQPEWHTYWKNPGDSGLPVSLSWTLPAGVSAGDIAWPLPTKIPVGNLVNYGYGDTVLLPVPLTISPQFKPLPGSDLEVKLQSTWLVCKTECVPQDGTFTLRVPLKGSYALHGADFEAAFKAQPRTLEGSSAIAIEGGALAVSVDGLPSAWHGKTLAFFPETPEVIESAAAWTQNWQGAQWHASVPIARYRGSDPATLPILLVAEVAGQRSGFVTQAAITGVWPKPGSLAPIATSTAVLPASAPSDLPASLWLALVGALVGGMILNLMPCVFPVLAIKVINLAGHADDLRAQRRGGLVYSVGVVLSFVALGALMLALRSAGEQLGWGFQLQSPAVVAALAVLFAVIGLNLAGVFEFGQFVPTGVASMQSSNKTANAFLSGVLAVAIASPCTAPFMGASLGLALGLPPLQALLIFTALGLGMALPFLALSWWPALAQRMPRPGPWMLTFRSAMAFPMFATVVWLVWVLGQQSGINGAAALLLLLVALSLVLWSLGLKGRGRRVIAALSIALLALLTGAIGDRVVTPVAAATSAGDARWQAWAPGKAEQLVAAGTPVFIDFTAAWCITCQVNEQTTLSNRAVLGDFDAKKVTLLRADWTRRDPAITAALAQLGRNGVPVYVLLAPGKAPVVFSEILSTSALRQAIASL